MYNLYLEEEGFLPSSKYYVLGGCILNSKFIDYTNREITQKKNYIYSTPFINLKDLANPNKKIIVYDGKNIRHFDSFTLLNILKDLPNIMKGTDIKLISTIVDKKRWNDINEYPNDFYYIAYKSLIKRFDNFLSEYECEGNMIIDYDRLHLRVNMETAHGAFVDKFKEFDTIKNITDSFHFLFSPNTNLSQLAYIFVKSIFNLFENNKDDCFNDFFPFILNKNGKTFNFGIEVYPEECINNISEKIVKKIKNEMLQVEHL